MNKSGLLQRREFQREFLTESITDMTRQMMMDTLQITINQGFGFGYNRIIRLCDAWEKTYDQYKLALVKGPEEDYIREKLDAALKEILHGRDLIAFSDRYPLANEISYMAKGMR